MKKLIALLLGSVSVAAHAATPRISLLELRSRQLNKAAIVIVDVRMPDDFAKGHIQGARNAPQGEVGTDFLAKRAKAVVYCTEDPCPMSDRAAEKLGGMGHEVSILADGFAGWKAKGYPIVIEKAGGKPRPGRITVKKVRDRVQKGDLTVLDARSPDEFRAGHVKGALNAPLESLTAGSFGFPMERDVLVYDRTAARARQAALILMTAGYKTYEMPGGLAGWLKKGNPLEVK